MGKKTPKAPAPPDPVATANAQAAANRETAITQRDLNLINQVTPGGNLAYTYGEPGPSGVATATATQTLSPGEQKIYESDVQARQQLGNIANSQLGQLGQSLGTPFTISGVPNLPDRVNSVGAQAPAVGNFNTMAYAGGTQQPQASQTVQAAQPVIDRNAAVTALYGNYLGRAPTAEDLTYWTAKDQGDLSTIESNIRANKEYQDKNAAAQAGGFSSGALYSDQVFNGNDLTQSGYQGGIISGFIPPSEGGGQSVQGVYGQYDAQGRPMWDPMATPPNGGWSGLGKPDGVDANGNPRWNGVPAEGGGQSGALQYSIKDAGAIGRTLDFTGLGDPNIERQRVEQALMDRMDPYLQRDRTALESRLANQGIALGSKAYSTGIDEANRTYNDARLGAIAAGGQEQSRLFALGLGQAQFSNEAQNQQFSQNMANAGMNNAAVGQQFNQNVTSANFQNQQRQNAITEALLQRQTPLNEISALMSGSQVNSPQFVNNPTTPVSPTDVTGPIYANYQGAMNNYNQRLQQNNAMMGGLFGLGGAALQSPWVGKAGAALMASDRRLKRNINEIGNLGNGIKLYSYEYVWGGGKRTGVMADEVKNVLPEAVVNIGGYAAVDYGAVLRSL